MSASPTANATGASADLVPIADRLRYLAAFRLLLVAVFAIAAAVAGDELATTPLLAAAASAGFLGVTLVATLSWRVSMNGAKHAFGAMLMLDGVFLAWASYVTGGAGSPVRYLIILHLIAVALLASHRTGVKLALWHSILLLVTYYAQDAELLRPLDADASLGIGTPFQQLLAFSAVFWLVAIVTASFSAVNERELRRRRFDLEALAVMARRLDEVSGSMPVADVLVGSVVDTFSADRALVLGAPDGGELTVLSYQGSVVADNPGPVHAGSIVREAMSSNTTLLTSHLDPATDATLAALVPDAKNLVIVPLSAGRQAIGVLIVEHPMRAGSRIERRVVGMLERFAAHGALALRNAWLLEEIQHLAATDPLTGIANRGTFQRVLGQELSRVRRNGGSVALALLDLDRFKVLNDTYGHVAGDDVLRGVAKVLDTTSRSEDTPARYGGEEFAVVLPETSPEEAMIAAERLRQAVSAAGIEPSVTVSIGVACFPQDAADGDELIRRADEALYASKRAGRDRVTAATQAALSRNEPAGTS